MVAGLTIAIVTNAFASRERRLVLPGYYPNALRVPPRVVEPAPTETVAQSPGPGQPAIPIETAPPAETATTTQGETPAAAEPATPSVVPATPATQPNAEPPAASVAQPAVDPLTRFKPHPDKASIEISGADAALLHARGVLFLDARRTSVFEEGHIAGARSFSVWEADIDDKVNALFGERSAPEDQDRPIVIYCSGGACEDSHMLAEKLWGIQFNNVYVYKDGYPDWLKRGGATRKGAQP